MSHCHSLVSKVTLPNCQNSLFLTSSSSGYPDACGQGCAMTVQQVVKVQWLRGRKIEIWQGAHYTKEPWKMPPYSTSPSITPWPEPTQSFSHSHTSTHMVTHSRERKQVKRFIGFILWRLCTHSNRSEWGTKNCEWGLGTGKKKPLTRFKQPQGWSSVVHLPS